MWNDKNKKVFITGAAGFIAGHLIAALESDGHEVWGCDISFSEHNRIRRIDVADFGGMERLIQFINPQTVIHLANFGNRYPDNFSYQKLWETNVIGTEHILELQRRYGFDLIYTSSSEIYGNTGGVLQEFTQGDWWYNDYAASKYLCEKLIKRQIEEHQQLRAVILRLFGVYGQGQPQTKDNSVIAQFIRKMKMGTEIEIHGCNRCFLYVADCVEAIMDTLDQVFYLPDAPVINIGSVESVSVRKLADMIAELLGIPYKESNTQKVLRGVKEKIPSIGLASQVLNWKPLTKLNDGLRLTINGAIPTPDNNRPFGMFVSVDGEKLKPRRLSTAERCADELLLMEEK